MVEKIDHIGIAVKNLDVQVNFYHDMFGLDVEEIREFPEQGVRVAWLPIGETRIELLEPTTPDGPIARFIARRGEGIHHIAYQVSRLETVLRKIDDGQVRLLDREPKIGVEGKKIAFLHPKTTFGVLTELCEADSSPTR